MRVTYPHMGNLNIALKALFTRLGHEVIDPPPITKKTITLGTKHSPEFACLPFKVNLGNFLEAQALGADTIVVAGGQGPCRFGYYGQAQAEILKEMGLPIRAITLESPQNKEKRGEGIAALVRGKAAFEVISAIYFAYAKIRASDRLEQIAHETRPFEKRHGETTRVFRELVAELDAARNIWQVRRVEARGRRALAAIPQDRTRPFLRIGVVGEIYFLLEPSANHHLEETLGYLGAVTRRSLYLSDWIRNHLILAPLGVDIEKHYAEAANPYLKVEIGGHARENLGKAVLFRREGYDGIVHISPLTCMPEIVSKSIFPDVSRDHGLPVLSLSLDEHSGEAGLETRLEAFVDLLFRRRAQAEHPA